MDFGPSEWAEEESDLYDKYEENAETGILEIISQHQVVTDRELKVRLERKIFPWVVGRTLDRLVVEDKVRVVSAPGRKGRMGTPKNFYMDPALNYEDILGLILRKRRVTAYVNSLLTRLSPAGFHAEDVFGGAFKSLRFEIVDREASIFGVKSVVGVPGKEPPNLDFILRKNKLTYGVDVKNWIKYEFDTIPEVMNKVNLAVQLGVIPFICARYVDNSTIYKIAQMGGMVYRYETLILPPEFGSLAEKARNLLGYPLLAASVLPSYKLGFIAQLHARMLSRSPKKK